MAQSLISENCLQDMLGFASGTPDGCFVEVGVYQGGSAQYLNKLAQEQGRELFLYDTFEGMPFSGELDGNWVGKFADCSAEAVQAACPGAHLCKGIFPETLVPMPPIAFIHADADQYQSTKDICTLLTPYMVDGGIVYFDDYSARDCEGCKKAVDEFFGEKIVVLPNGKAMAVINRE